MNITPEDVETFWTRELGQRVEIITRGWVDYPTDYGLWVEGTFMVAYKHLDEIEDYLAVYFMKAGA